MRISERLGVAFDPCDTALMWSLLVHVVQLNITLFSVPEFSGLLAPRDFRRAGSFS